MHLIKDENGNLVQHGHADSHEHTHEPVSYTHLEKQRIISKVAMFYLIAHGYRELPPCRFDVVGIDGENIHWIKNAFDFCS